MPNTLTTSEAAELAGCTPKAIKHRLDRGQLRYVVRGGRRRIPASELVRAGLLDAGAVGAAAGAAGADGNGRPHSAPISPVDLCAMLRELIGKGEQQAEEIGRLRALTTASDATDQARATELAECRAELVESRARVVELEAREASRRRWFRRG